MKFFSPGKKRERAPSWCTPAAQHVCIRHITHPPCKGTVGSGNTSQIWGYRFNGYHTVPNRIVLLSGNGALDSSFTRRLNFALHPENNLIHPGSVDLLLCLILFVLNFSFSEKKAQAKKLLLIKPMKDICQKTDKCHKEFKTEHSPFNFTGVHRIVIPNQIKVFYQHKKQRSSCELYPNSASTYNAVSSVCSPEVLHCDAECVLP